MTQHLQVQAIVEVQTDKIQYLVLSLLKVVVQEVQDKKTHMQLLQEIMVLQVAVLHQLIIHQQVQVVQQLKVIQVAEQVMEAMVVMVK